MFRADGLFKIIERVYGNAYKVDLPRDYAVSATFSIAYLRGYQEEDHLTDLWSNLFNKGRMMEAL